MKAMEIMGCNILSAAMMIARRRNVKVSEYPTRYPAFGFCYWSYILFRNQWLCHRA